jgi:CheY-like chemotaxis protein
MRLRSWENPIHRGRASPTRGEPRVLPTPAHRHRCDDRLMAVSVLLVDDDPTFLSLAERTLACMGIEVVATAQDPAAAIEAANATRAGAALVDIGLPDREGIDLAYELAALPWARVVLTSTDRDPGSALDVCARPADRAAPLAM